MELFNPRKLKFRAWNMETRLLTRLHNIECVKGELLKKHHILLQFTGLYDTLGEEIYDMDVLLVDNLKFLVRWGPEQNGWIVSPTENTANSQPAVKKFTERTVRLLNFFESERSAG